jgi:GNAT superfamily N-acetyltransferase
MSGRSVETVVTYLELRALPGRLPPQPAGPRLALMRADPMPLHFYRYLYATIGRDWWWIERLRLDDDALASLVQRPGVEISVLYGDGAPAGYFELDFAAGDHVDLFYFGLMPEWTGRRVGPWFLGCAVSAAFSRGAASVAVNTCTLDHPGALPLYQKLGFEPVAREPRTIESPDDLPLPDRFAAQSLP